MDIETIAVFIATDFLEIERVRAWTKTVPKHVFVLMTDDPTEQNTALARDLRCADIVCAMVRTPGTRRSPPEVEQARKRRDEYMASLASSVLDFGRVPGGAQRFAGRMTTVVEPRGPHEPRQ